MSNPPASVKAKIRPGRKSLRSESGSENALRRASSARDETLDYEIAPTPSVIVAQNSPHSATHTTSSESVRHIGLNFGECLTEDTETPLATPTSAPVGTKYGATRELPKNWSDDESASFTEPESVKSGTCVCVPELLLFCRILSYLLHLLPIWCTTPVVHLRLLFSILYWLSFSPLNELCHPMPCH